MIRIMGPPAVLLALAGACPVNAAPPLAGYPAPGRPVAPVISTSWWDPAARDQADEVGQIARALALRPGMTVADIGAGDGYDSLRLARKVGPTGRVLAEDLSAPALDTLRRGATAAGLANITTLRGAAEDPGLASGSIDAAIMVHMYHEIASPYALLAQLAPAFRPGGRLAIEELDRPTERHGTPHARLTCELAAAGYHRVAIRVLAGGLGYLAVFTPPKAPVDPARIKPCGTS